jgi:hypothetical protein
MTPHGACRWAHGRLVRFSSSSQFSTTASFSPWVRGIWRMRSGDHRRHVVLTLGILLRYGACARYSGAVITMAPDAGESVLAPPA